MVNQITRIRNDDGSTNEKESLSAKTVAAGRRCIRSDTSLVVVAGQRCIGSGTSLVLVAERRCFGSDTLVGCRAALYQFRYSWWLQDGAVSVQVLVFVAGRRCIS